ncbi:hypothetical protein Trco_000029 [Trichoderma cornu-damae]|uniref:Uncharacterized protein n=1 Tax=Trichoderma cornu-damae TaxID=654480 RepID=A0A9P8TYM6_9HYPO|nr:hypothetical protein Trco_000029 [Trichoderma cornu-damae]
MSSFKSPGSASNSCEPLPNPIRFRIDANKPACWLMPSNLVLPKQQLITKIQIVMSGSSSHPTSVTSS